MNPQQNTRQDDPALYSQQATSQEANTQSRHSSQIQQYGVGQGARSGVGRLPPMEGIDQSHQLPPLSNHASIQEPFYRLPTARGSVQQSPALRQDQGFDPGAAPYAARQLPNRQLQNQPRMQSQSQQQQQQQQRQASLDSGPSPLSGANSDPDEPMDPVESKRPRACEACRGLKVRCDRDENEPDRPCRRCAKARRNCIITAPSRKRQKKTDSRVAELERKIDALTADLKKHRSGGANSSPTQTLSRDARPISPPRSNYSASATSSNAVPPKGEPWKRDLEDRAAATTGRGFQRSARNSSLERTRKSITEDRPDVENYMLRHRRLSNHSDDSDISSSTQDSSDFPFDSVVDSETATRIFDRYVAEMAQHLPAVMFESFTTAAEIRANRPILFLAILDTASVGMLSVETQQRLNEMLLDVYANSILRQGEKSLDLVQALMVSTIWYRPPKRYEQMNVYMLTHIAAVMALDFGMGRKLNASRNMRVAANVGQNAAPKTFLRSDSVEARRTWLGCYFVCMNVSLSLRRPNFIRWNSYLEECVKVLESAPETLPSDKRLCQHVRLMHINEEIGVRFSMDDPSASIAISDPRVQFAIGAFEKRLEEWDKTVPKTQWDLSLQFSKHFSRLYMHEIALHNNHNIDDFRAPFTEESLKAPSLQVKTLSPYHSGLLQHCLDAVHDMFNTFADFDMVTVKALPIFYFVRIAYAVVVLIKLHAAVSDPNSAVSFKQGDLRVENHLDRLLQVFQRMAQEDAFRPARMFMIIVGKLRDGFKNAVGKGPGLGAMQKPTDEPSEKFALEAMTTRDKELSHAKSRKNSKTKTKSSAASDTSSSRQKTPTRASISDSPQAMSQVSEQQQQQLQQLSQQLAQQDMSHHHHHQQQQLLNQQQLNLQAQNMQQTHPGLQYSQQQQQHGSQILQHQQQSTYGASQSPLHFLSEVATNGTPQNVIAYGPQQLTSQAHQQWYGGGNVPMHPNAASMMLGGLDFGQATMDPAFEQAVDMTMSIGEGDLSSLFMDSGDFTFATGLGSDDQSMGAFGQLPGANGPAHGGGW